MQQVSPGLGSKIRTLAKSCLSTHPKFQLVDYGDEVQQSRSELAIDAHHGLPQSILDRAKMLRLVKYADDSSSSAVASEALRNATWLRVQAIKAYSDLDDADDVAVERLTRCLSCL